MVLWLAIDEDLSGDKNEAGYPAWGATNDVLTHWEILTADSRETARYFLRCLAWGRIDGRNEKVEPEKPLKGSS